MKNDGLRRALAKIEGGDPRAMAWLGRLAAGEFASSRPASPTRPGVRLHPWTVHGDELLAALDAMDGLTPSERAALTSWWRDQPWRPSADELAEWGIAADASAYGWCDAAG